MAEARIKTDKHKNGTKDGSVNGQASVLGNDAGDRTYRYDPVFRNQIMALTLKSGWLARFPSVVAPNFFPLQSERSVVTKILEHHERYGTPPLLGDLVVELPDEKESLEKIFELSKKSLDKTSNEAIEWAKDQAMLVALHASIDDYQSGKYRQIRERVSKALSVGEDVLSVGNELVGGVKSWSQAIDVQDVVTTCWLNVNRRIGGGLGAGELGTLVGKAGGYKTTALINLGYWAAGITNSRNVLHFTLEMSERKILERYAARATFKTLKQVPDVKEYAELLNKHAKTKLRGRIRVKSYPTGQATVAQLRDFITLLKEKENFVPGMIIVDYPALLRPSQNYQQRRFELQNIFADLRAMAGSLGVPMWTGAQSNRGSYGRYIIKKEDIAEDLGIMQISDLVLSINQTTDEEEVDVARLCAIKTREDKVGCHVKLEIKYPAMHDRGYVKEKEKGD